MKGVSIEEVQRLSKKEYICNMYVSRTCAQNGTEKDSQEGLKMESSRQKKKQARLKMTLRKTFELDLKKMELPWGTAEREAKERHSWKKKE